MASADRPKFTIIGAGPGGALLAAHLGQMGRTVDLYELRRDQRVAGAIGGRSINLALSTRGLVALGRIGIAESVLRRAIPMRGRMIHARDGHLAYQPYDKDPARWINSISRAELNNAILDAAERFPDVRVRFEQRCLDVDLRQPSARILDLPSGQTSHIDADILVGADGAFSAVRAAMQRTDRFEYSQSYLEHGYKELTIPAAPAGGFALEPNALHIWPRRSYMMIALPNFDGSFTCTLFWPFEGPNSFASLRTEADVLAYFRQEFPDAVPLMPDLARDFLEHAVGSMVTVRCRPWHCDGKVVLLGDAAHAVVPFYGQGMNAAFEDCTVLAECLSQHADCTAAFAAYEDRRKTHTDALADLAVENFVEMRDHTGSPRFLRKKRRERRLATWFPGWYTPLYTMVTFTCTPYADAVERARRQERIVRRVEAAVVAILVLVVGVALWAVLNLRIEN